MLLKIALYLANCDSVQKRPLKELKKRIVWGLVVAERIVVTPHILLDNKGIEQVLGHPDIARYLKHHPHKLLVRHHGAQDVFSCRRYFDGRDGEFIVSSVAGSPRKRELTAAQQNEVHQRLDRLDDLLQGFKVGFERHDLTEHALTAEIRGRLNAYRVEEAESTDRPQIGEREIDSLNPQDRPMSRSAWYQHLQEVIPDPAKRLRLTTELVDPAYNSLFIERGQAFAADRIPVLGFVPEVGLDLLQKGAAYARELHWAKTAWGKAKLIHTLGTSGVVEWMKDIGTDMAKDWFLKHSESIVAASWRSLYLHTLDYIGVEIKP